MRRRSAIVGAEGEKAAPREIYFGEGSTKHRARRTAADSPALPLDLKSARRCSPRISLDMALQEWCARRDVVLHLYKTPQIPTGGQGVIVWLLLHHSFVVVTADVCWIIDPP